MKNLTNSIVLLLAYLFLVLGLAQIRYFELHVLYFQAAFFIIMTLAVFAGVLHFGRYRMPLYGFLGIWALVYIFTWQFYWRSMASPPDPSEVAIQFLLMEVAAGLAHNVGTHLHETEVLLESLSTSTYPNRTLEMKSAGDRIQTEITRSRRYNRPLSVLILRLSHSAGAAQRQQLQRLERDLFERFAMAKVGQIINSHARQTDLIMRDAAGRFVILCPETDFADCGFLAERIRAAVSDDMGDRVSFGIASFPQETLDFEELVQKAIQRLNQNSEPVKPLAEDAAKRPVG